MDLEGMSQDGHRIVTTVPLAAIKRTISRPDNPTELGYVCEKCQTPLVRGERS
jgi:hypothetical protein